MPKFPLTPLEACSWPRPPSLHTCPVVPSAYCRRSGGLSPSRYTSLFSAQKGCFSNPLQSCTCHLGPVGHLTTCACQPS